MIVVPVLVLGAVNKKTRDYGLNLGKGSQGLSKSFHLVLLFIVAAVPFAVYGSGLQEFKSYYPMWKGEGMEISSIVYFEILTGVTMLATEFFFRGFLIFPFRGMGRMAWLPQLVPYVLVHVGKPWAEVLVSIPAGIAFGMMAYRSKSVVPGFLSHWAVAVLFDFLVLL